MPLLRSNDVQKRRQEILNGLNLGTADIDAVTRKLIEIDPDDGFPYIILGQAAGEMKRLDDAEALLWKAMALAPCGYAPYLFLAAVFRERNPEDSIVETLVTLAMWRLAFLDRIPSEVATTFSGMMGGKLDFSDPETYGVLAASTEIAKPELTNSPEIIERLLPYLLLNELDRQAGSAVNESVVRGILRNADRCVPVLRAALREWASNPERLGVATAGLIGALLGEMDGPELIGDILSADFLNDEILFPHTNWAVWRLCQRYPEEGLRYLSAMIPAAPCALRCALAEHIGMLPPTQEATSALLSLLDGFSKSAADPDAACLLLTIFFFLMQRKQKGQAEKVIRNHVHLLTKDSRKWFDESIQSEDPFVPALLEMGIEELTIERVCLEGALLPDEDLDDEEEDESGDEPVEQYIAPVRPGRNDPCWCGSGQKYKKCHMSADESGPKLVH